MPIVTGDIVYRLSGGASNTDATAAIGGAMSTVAGGIITSAVLNNLFDDVTGDESAAGDIEYRCFYIENNHGTLTWSTVKHWVQTVSPSTDSVFAIGLDPAGKNGTAATPADEDTAPAGVTFTSPTSKATGLTVGDLLAGDNYPVWVRRTITAAASAYSSDGPTLRTEGDTPA